MNNWGFTFAIYSRLIGIQIRAQLQYRMAFLLEVLASGLTLFLFLRQLPSYSNALAISAAGRVILIGASMGGLLALKMAETVQPTALVLVNSVPPAGVGALRTSKRYPAIVRWANGPLAETRSALFDSDEATIQWAWPRWRDESGAVLNAMAAGLPVQPPLAQHSWC